MGTTTRGFRYPEATDAPDGPVQIHNLASDVQDELDGTLAVGALTSSGIVIANGGADVQAALAAAAYQGRQPATQPILANRLLGSDAQFAYVVKGDGTIEWGAGGSSARDTNLYRSAADTLKTDDSLQVVGEMNAGGVGTTRVRTGDMSGINGATQGGIAFGSALDTNLYRSAADTLKTDDSLVVAGTLSAADATYRILQNGVSAIGAGVTAGTYALQENGLSGVLLAVATSVLPFYFDPADYAITGKTTKLRIRANVGVGSTAPGAVTFTVGLYPLTGPTASLYVPGTVTSGSTVAFASPGANASAQGNSGDFNAPSAGYYALGVAISATTAASSTTGMRATLQLRHV